MTVLLSVLSSIIAGLITIEVIARAPRLSVAALERAVMGLPRKYRARFHEEWSADMLDQPSQISQLIFAAGLLLASQRISTRERRRVLRLRRQSYYRRVGLTVTMFLFGYSFDVEVGSPRGAIFLRWVAPRMVTLTEGVAVGMALGSLFVHFFGRSILSLL